MVFPKFTIFSGLGFEWPGWKSTGSLELLRIRRRGLFPFVGGGRGGGTRQGRGDGELRWEWSRESAKDLKAPTDVERRRDEGTEEPT